MRTNRWLRATSPLYINFTNVMRRRHETPIYHYKIYFREDNKLLELYFIYCETYHLLDRELFNIIERVCTSSALFLQ